MSKLNENRQAILQQGLVISYFGNSVAVEAQDGQVFQCHLRRNQELPVAGDQVQWQLDQAETGTIATILPRKSLLARGDKQGNMKPLAANIDLFMIVMAPPPVFSEYLLDRYLVAAELLNLNSIIVLNKKDLLDPSSEQSISARLKPYVDLYPIVFSSIFIEKSLLELSTLLSHKKAALVGPSGVGKSSLIAALAQNDVRVGEVSAKGAGKHTTTATRLYHLPEGGALIDSPGVREFNLWPIKWQDILRGFKEFAGVAQKCKFRDCKHIVEPGCAIQAAVAQGEISKERFDSYQALIKNT